MEMDGAVPSEDLLTMAEAAEALKVSQVTVARWLKQGRLPHRTGSDRERCGSGGRTLSRC